MMKRKPVMLLFLLVFLSVVAVSQQYNLDSIRGVVASIHTMPADTAQVKRLRETGGALIDVDSGLAKQLLQEALEKSISLREPDAITNSYRMLGIWYSNFDDKDKALDCYRASLQMATSNNHLYLMAGANFNIGNIKYWKGEYDSCIDYYLVTARLYDNPDIFNDETLTERILDKKKSDLYSNLSSAFNTLNNLPKADEYIEKAIAIAHKYNSPAAANALAYYMQQKADNYSSNGQVAQALNLRLQYLSQLEKGVGGKSFLQGSYQNISQEYFTLGKIDSSKTYAGKSLQTGEEAGIPEGIASANLQLGRIALAEKKFALAETFMDKCQAYFMESEDPVEKRLYFDVMRQLKYSEGQYKEAYGYFEKYTAINDSILNSERTRQFSEREARYQSEKKDNQIKWQQASIRQKNTLNYLLIGSAIVLLLLSALGYRNYTQKQKLQQQRISELETEKKLMATEAVLKGEEQERTRLAKDLHDGLGGMLSGIKYSFNTMKGNLIMTPENQQAFERSIDMLDSSIREMRRVAHNLMPEALVKFGLDTALKDFCNDINQSGALHVDYQSIGLANETIDQTMAITIYRIVQELINNTIKHAKANHAIVQMSKTNGVLSVTVEDNGKGFDPALLQPAKGIGWSNIKNRVEFLKGKLDINSQPGKGTSVLIELAV